ncbi:DUF1543 domain-containing protein [Mucilaginibacter panaciglaebae]|uniref:DUF1543 domain-containing protein n=1 Tax=Mucilaginibacter panaciglaebae TaxID=502331 RepID=A0ABP7X0R5_9SPHI
MDQQSAKLYMLLLGSKAPGRHVEQHDFFFGIASSLKQLVPDIKAFWRGATGNLHIDAYREVNYVDGYKIEIIPRDGTTTEQANKLFFINLGGYVAGKFAEQHHVILSVKASRAQALQDARDTAFFETNTIAGNREANAHIDDKYGFDVDDIYNITEMLTPAQKAKYRIRITPAEGLADDKVHLGYFPLNKL